MVLQRLSEHAFMGEYCDKEYFVIFDGTLVLPKCDYYTRLLDLWDDVNTILCDPRVSAAAGCRISLDYDSGLIMIISKEDGTRKQLEAYSSDFKESLKDFLCKYLSDVVTDISGVVDAAQQVANNLRERNMSEYSGLSDDTFTEDNHREMSVGKKVKCTFYKRSGKYYTEEIIDMPTTVSEEHNFPDYVIQHYIGKFSDMHIVCTLEDGGVPFMLPADVRSEGSTLDDAFNRLKNV